jgi:two-component system, NarL family, response regulator LiaR
MTSGSETQPTERPAFARIIIADDHLAFRGMLSYVLDMEEGLQVVGQAEDGVEVLELCRRLQPELVIMDLRMPKMDGCEATRAIKKELPHTSVLVLTALTDPHHSSQALEAGAEDCVLKYTSLKEIVGAIRSVLTAALIRVDPEANSQHGRTSLPRLRS